MQILYSLPYLREIRFSLHTHSFESLFFPAIATMKLHLALLFILFSYTAAALDEPTQTCSVSHKARSASCIKRSVPNLKPLDAKRRLLAKRSYAREAVSGELLI